MYCHSVRNQYSTESLIKILLLRPTDYTPAGHQKITGKKKKRKYCSTFRSYKEEFSCNINMQKKKKQKNHQNPPPQKTSKMPKPNQESGSKGGEEWEIKSDECLQ